MKKIIGSLLFSGLFMFILPLVCQNRITAYAENDYEFSVTELTSDLETDDDIIIPANSVKVTLGITNNSGYAIAVYQFPYDSSVFEIIPGNNTTDPYILEGNGMHNLTCEAADNSVNGIVAVSIMGTHNCNNDGDILSFFLRLKSTAGSLDQYDIEDLIGEPNFVNVQGISGLSTYTPTYTVPEVFQYTFEVPYSYVLGNANGSIDGLVTLEDAQVIYTLVETYGELMVGDSVPGLYYSPNSFYAGLFLQINGIYTLSLEIADVNSDGYVNYADASAVFSYYMNNLAQLDPYSTPIGQTQTHITYIVAFS